MVISTTGTTVLFFHYNDLSGARLEVVSDAGVERGMRARLQAEFMVRVERFLLMLLQRVETKELAPKSH